MTNYEALNSVLETQDIRWNAYLVHGAAGCPSPHRGSVCENKERYAKPCMTLEESLIVTELSLRTVRFVSLKYFSEGDQTKIFLYACLSFPKYTWVMFPL